jgi:heat shock protein HtpX
LRVANRVRQVASARLEGIPIAWYESASTPIFSHQGAARQMIPVTARAHRVRNLAQTLMLIGGLAAILALSSQLLLGDDLWLWVFALMVLFMLSIPYGGSQWVLTAYRARPLSPRDAPALHAMVAELARRAKLSRRPALFWVPSQSLNAFSVGVQQDSAIAVTDGLIRRLSPREMAGVLAHEISHIAHNDMRLMGLADLVSRMTHLMSLLGALLVLVALPLMLAGLASVSPLGMLLLMAAPSLSALLQLGLSRVREFDADLGAVRLTGDPEGLALALNKLDPGQGRWWQRVLNPRYRDRQPSLLRSHPHSQERIERLLALQGQSDARVMPMGLHSVAQYNLPGGYRVLHAPRHRILFGVWR